MTGRTSRLQPTRTAANLLLCCQSAQLLCHSGVIILGGGKTSEVLQTLLCCQTRATVLPFALGGAAQPFSCSTRWSCFCCYSSLSQTTQNEIGVSLASSFAVCEAASSISESWPEKKFSCCCWESWWLCLKHFHAPDIGNEALVCVAVTNRIPAAQEASACVWRCRGRCFIKCINSNRMIVWGRVLPPLYQGGFSLDWWILYKRKETAWFVELCFNQMLTLRSSASVSS